jgi:chemotaxis protein MotB
LQSQGEKLQTVQAQIENLTTEFENTIRSRTDLETQVAKLKNQQIKGREETQSLAMKLEKKQAEKQTLIRELTQAHDNITSDQIEFQNQQKELEAARSLIVNLQLEIQKHEKGKAVLEETVSDYKTQIVDLTGQVDKAKAEQAVMNGRLSTLETEKAKLEEKVSGFNTQIRTLNKDRYEGQLAVQTKQKELEAVRSQNVILKEEVQKNQAVLEETVSDDKTQIIDLTEKVDRATAEQAVMSGRLSTLETEKAELEEKVSGFNTQIRALNKDRYEGQLAVQNKQKELEAVRSQNVILKEEVQKNQAVKAVLEKEVSGFKAQLLDLKDTHQRIQTIQKEIQKTADINSLLKNQISILQLQLNNYQEKTLNYAGTIEEKESQLKQIVSNLNSCLVNSKDVEVSLHTAQSQVVNLMGMVEQARAEQVVMSKQLTNLETEKAEMALKLTEVKKTYDTLIRELHDKIENKEAVIEDCDKKFSVTFIDRVLFYSGKASITTAGQGILKKTGDILGKMRFGVIRIAGHTDNVPIRRGWRGRFPTNWELSSARAAAVARFFQKESNISPENMEVVGFGSHRPVAANTTREGRAKNRRVEITIAPMGPTVRSARSVHP